MLLKVVMRTTMKDISLNTVLRIRVMTAMTLAMTIIKEAWAMVAVGALMAAT